MGLFGKKGKSKKSSSADEAERLIHKDSFELSGNTSVIDEDIVALLDQALTNLGGELMHAIDPRRILSFESGGPPVWSVGVMNVADEQPYSLLVTYGFSHILAPEHFREPFEHEYSIALPAYINPAPWADALLRHLSQYVLTSGSELCVGDVMPCYAPITCLPFQPEHHSKMPPTPLVGVVVADDPVIDQVETPKGKIKIRRLLGIHQDELDRVETWSAPGFVEEYLKKDKLLLSDLARPSLMQDPEFKKTVDQRAAKEGSQVPAIMLDASWEDLGQELAINLPGGQQAEKLLAALRGRLPFGQRLLVVSQRSAPIGFMPADQFNIDMSSEGLIISGNLDDPNLTRIVESIKPETQGTQIRFPIGN